jgi:hypothetical protein
MDPQTLPTRDWVDYCQALLTPMIAVLGILIACLQWRTNHQHLKLERFDRRFRRFEATRKFMQALIMNPTVNESDRIKFLSETTGSRFLFNKDISEYLTQIHDKGVDLQTLDEERKSDPTKAKDRGELKKWFIAELESLEDRFAKYF